MAALAQADRDAITDLVHQFFWLVDHGRADETGALFAPTAALTFAPGSPKPGTLEGPAIAEAMKARAAQREITTRHVLSNITLTPRPDGQVEGYLLLTLFRASAANPPPDPAAVADIEDVYVKTAEGWRIARRVITPIFSRT